MKIISKNDKGFTAVEGLLIVLILAVIGFGGYYINHSQHKNTTSSASSNTKTSNSSSTTANTAPIKYFTISSWGIRTPYSGSLKLEYNIQTSNGLTFANLSSVQLDNSDAACSSSGNYGGVLTRYSSTEDVQDESGDSGLTPAAYFIKYDISPSLYAHIGNYYYLYTHPQGVCGSSTSSQDIQTQTDQAFEAIVQNLKAE